MPNLDFNFSSTTPKLPANKYPFVGSGLTGEPIEISNVDGYGGALVEFVFYTKLDYDFTLCYYRDEDLDTQLNILDFDLVACAQGLVIHGANCEFDLEFVKRNNVNLGLCEYPASTSHQSFAILEYISSCADHAMRFGSVVEFELEADRLLGNRYDLALMCPRPDPAPGEVVLEYEVQDYYHVIATGCVEFELTTDRADPLPHYLTLCHGYSASTPDPAYHDLPAQGGNPDSLESFNGAFEAYQWILEYEPTCAIFDMQLSGYEYSHTEFTLEVEKNLEFDLNLCINTLNPPLDYSEQDPHDLEFLADYTETCDPFRFFAYHGGAAEATILDIVEFTGINAYGGEYSDMDIQVTPHFTGVGYGGALNEIDLTIFTALELDIDYYSGHNTECDLAAFKIIYDVDGYHGAYGDLELEVPKPVELDLFNYHGGTHEITLSTFPIIQVDSGYHGAYGDLDLDTSPSQPIEADAYHGGYGVGDMIVYPQFSCDAYHGSYGECDIELAPSEGVGIVNAYHGGYADAFMNVTFALYPEGYSGAYADAELSTSLALESNFYSGAYGDCDFTDVPPPELEPIVYHGAHSIFNSLSITVAMYARGYGGAYSDSDLETSPGEPYSFDCYGGALNEIDNIENDPWNFFAYEGAYSEAGLSPQVNIGPADCYGGEYGEDVELNYDFVALDIDAYFGSAGIQDALWLPPPPTFNLNGYGGEHCAVEAYILIYPTFKVRFIHDLAMYDGVEGLGGLNFCESDNLNCHAKYPALCSANTLDTTESFPLPLDGDWSNYDPHLYTRFDETGFSPFYPCNENHGTGHMEFELATEQRLDCEAYHGADARFFIERELSSFGDVPPEVLYSENGQGDRQDHIDNTHLQDFFQFYAYGGEWGVTWFNGPDDFIIITGTHGDTNLTTYDNLPPGGFVYAGEAAIQNNLSVYKPEWREYIKEMHFGSWVDIDFNPEIWMRFCPGYLIPEGTNVVLDFGSTDNTDCFFYSAAGGFRADFELFATMHPQLRSYSGEYARSSLDVQTKWTLYARHGQLMQQASEPTMSVDFRDGSYVLGQFYDAPTFGYHGAHAVLDALIVAGPAVEWRTETGCLPNEYVPLTESGDIDYEALEPDENGVLHWPTVPVEHMPYFTPLLAECITYAEPDPEPEE